jgi:hypothetical protein
VKRVLARGKFGWDVLDMKLENRKSIRQGFSPVSRSVRVGAQLLQKRDVDTRGLRRRGQGEFDAAADRVDAFSSNADAITEFPG